MTAPLNLYATKVFAEHPVSLWAMDENAGYISLLTPSDHDLSNWSVTNATNIPASSMLVSHPTAPLIEQTPVAAFKESPDSVGVIKFSSSSQVDYADINLEMGTVSLGFYVFTPDRTIDVITGYSINDDIGEVIKRQTVKSLYNESTQSLEPSVDIPGTIITPLSRKGWAFISTTLYLPEAEFASLSPIIEIHYEQSVVDYEFAVHAVTWGQWSEEFQSTSLGAQVVSLPTEVPITGSGVEALPYGLQGLPGYYLVSNNSLCAKNSGLPLVYGSANSTVITPNPNAPSVILPGYGVFSTFGQGKQDATYEFWANIQSNAVQERKIFGAVSDTSGLYVDRHQIKLKVFNKSGSYSVGEWGRPMLFAIRVSQDSASLLLNGKEVIRIRIDNMSSFLTSSDDWVGFYAYEDVPVIQIEAPAIYPYLVPEIVQKRRFVYGQGVEEPTSIKGLNHSSIIAIDNSMAGYAKNVSYPDRSSWKFASLENVDVNSNTLSQPDYGLPTLFLNKNKDSWLANSLAEFDVNNPSFKVKHSDEEGYLYFSTFNFLAEAVRSFYIKFEGGLAGETLAVFENPTNGSALNIVKSDTGVSYQYRNKPSSTFLEFATAEANNGTAGIDVSKTSENFVNTVGLISFLKNIQSSRVYLGGAPGYQNTFSGSIKSFGICSNRNFNKIDDASKQDNGLLINISDAHIATYKLVPVVSNMSFKLEIAAESVWEDYTPLSYFGTYQLDRNNEKFFALDFLQFNVDFVRLENFSDNLYDTEGLPAKFYVSFQFLKEGANKKLENFGTIKPLGKDRVVDPGEDWIDTAFEVVDDSVLKVPQGFDIDNLALVVHIHIESSSSIADRIKIRNLNLSSRGFGEQVNKIRTKFGTELIPYKKSGNAFDYKNVKPFSMAKGSTPYLYLSKNSGIRPLVPNQQTQSPVGDGISIPFRIAEDAEFFSIDMMQLFLRYEGSEFPVPENNSGPVKLFEISAGSETIEFMLRSDHPTYKKRGQIYALQNGTLRDDIMFFIDGKPVRRPILNPNIWTALSITFTSPLSLSRDEVGAIRFTSSLVRFDNISYYQVSQEDEVDRFAYRKWSAVRSGVDTPYTWATWQDSTWQEVLYLVSTDAELTDAQKIYGTFVGTNSFIFDSSSTLLINNYRHSAYKDTSWSTFIVTPV